MVVMNVDLLLHMRNDLACKDKQGSIFGKFNKIFDHILVIGQNDDYWAMSL
jgi:hypothetical protein